MRRTRAGFTLLEMLVA
ncbi:TPA: prepilin-type N-terminal cleavage/methylation domain-containing protein, partial [Escherichia coli]|nr:prepilin-type N-terminal cleavage/methylation domain-containing protein [Escherichia coli]